MGLIRILLILFVISVKSLCATESSIKWGGEVKAKWYHSGDTGQFKTECSLKGKYSQNNASADIKIKVYNEYSETLNGAIKVALEKAMIGYTLDSDINTEIFIELGRTKLEYLFDSKIQYNGVFNGIHIGLKKENLIIHGGPIVVNSTMNHFGAVGEVVLQNILEFPISFTYSLTNWFPASAAVISQAIVKYTVGAFGTKDLILYGAFLRNHEFRGHSNGYYFGAVLGKIEKAKDFMVDINYQYAGDYSIPRHDYAGIGDGIQLKTIYALTDHFSLQGKFNVAKSKNAEISAIYAW